MSDGRGWVRPLTPSLIEEIALKIRESGLSYRMAALSCGAAAPSAYRWAKTGRELAELWGDPEEPDYHANYEVATVKEQLCVELHEEVLRATALYAESLLGALNKMASQGDVQAIKLALQRMDRNMDLLDANRGPREVPTFAAPIDEGDIDTVLSILGQQKMLPGVITEEPER